MSSNARVHRRSLKECLKTILQRRRDDPDDDLIIGSGILKRKDPSLTVLPDFSSVSSLPDFNSSRFDIDQYSVAIPSRNSSVATRIWAADYSQHTITPYTSSTTSLGQHDVQDAYQYQAGLGQLAKSCSGRSDNSSSKASLSNFDLTRFETISSQGSLLPKTSLDQLVTPESIQFQSPLSQLAHACNVPSIYRHGASLQASLASLDSHTQSVSTVGLQRSTRDLSPIPELRQAPRLAQPVPVRHQVALSPVSDANKGRPTRRSSSRNMLRDRPTISIPSLTQDRPVHRIVEEEFGAPNVNYLSSFCVLDAAAPGCPVTMTSQDLRYVFDIGEEFFLNTVAIDETDVEIITGEDSQGNPVIHFVLFSPLVSAHNGRTRFVLASMLDITSLLMDDMSVPDLETISEESFVDKELMTPPTSAGRRLLSYELSAENLLGGCFVPERDMCTPVQAPKDDIWLDIASEESRKSRSDRASLSTPRSNSTTSSSSRDFRGNRENMLDRFLASVKQLYSDFILLANPPLAENSWEICNVSPKVYASREFIAGYLARTSATDIAELEKRLTEDTTFCMRVRWGAAGALKQLYCIPLYGRSNVTWICFIVDEGKWADIIGR